MTLSTAADATLELAQDLIRRPSVSPEDHGCLELIGQRLEAVGFRVERMPFGPVENCGRGTAGRPVLCFAGHTDVVPTGPREEWQTEPFEPVVRDGMLYGRGAADMKSGLAAMVTAAERFVGALRSHAARSRSCSRATRKDRRSTARGAWSKRSRRAASRSTGAWSASRGAPTRSAIPSRSAAAARSPASSPCTAFRVMSPIRSSRTIPCTRRARARRARGARLGQGQRVLPADQLPGLEHRGRHRRAERDPGELKARFNLRYSTEQTVEKLHRR